MKRPRTPIPTGTRFDRLTVEGPAPDRRRAQGRRAAYWCLCNCGERVSVAADSLRAGITRSCGCLVRDTAQRRRLPVPVGERFGRLVVEGDAPPGKRGMSYWSCRCDCGRVCTVRADNLRSGHAVSCGCARRAK